MNYFNSFQPITTLQSPYSTPLNKINFNTPNMNVGITGNNDQLINLLTTLSNIKNKNSDKSQETNSDNFMPLSLDSFIDETNELRPLQQTITKQSHDGYKMIKNSSTGNNELVYTNNGISTHYTGSGVMIFTNYMNRNGRNEPSVILFRSSVSGNYEELGGNIDLKDFDGKNTLLKTAVREAREESANLFNIININALHTTETYERPHIDRNVNSKIYRCYALVLSNTNNESWKYIYSTNQNHLKAANAPKQWMETNDVQFFYINEIAYELRNVSRGNITCLDTEGIMRTIGGRTKACLREILKDFGGNGSQIEMAYMNPKMGTFVKGTGSGLTFLDNTTTITIN